MQTIALVDDDRNILTSVSMALDVTVAEFGRLDLCAHVQGGLGPELGWGEPEDRDGSLIFLHETQLSQRFAEEGQKRTATVIFELTEGIDFSILAEAPD